MLKKLIELHNKMILDSNYTKEECFIIESVIEILEKLKRGDD